MTEEFQTNVSAAASAASSIVLNDLGQLSGINPAYAQTLPMILGAYMNAKAMNGQDATPLDSYALGVIQGLAALLTADSRQAAACFEDIAAWAIGGAAHCRTALDAERKAQQAQEAAGVAQAKADAERAAQTASKRTVGAKPDLTKAQTVPGVTGDLTNAPDLAAIGADALRAHGMIPQDPREVAPQAYDPDAEA